LFAAEGQQLAGQRRRPMGGRRWIACTLALWTFSSCT
jgi:hypothetical protein